MIRVLTKRAGWHYRAAAALAVISWEWGRDLNGEIYCMTPGQYSYCCQSYCSCGIACCGLHAEM